MFLSKDKKSKTILKLFILVLVTFTLISDSSFKFDTKHYILTRRERSVADNLSLDNINPSVPLEPSLSPADYETLIEGAIHVLEKVSEDYPGLKSIYTLITNNLFDKYGTVKSGITYSVSDLDIKEGGDYSAFNICSPFIITRSADSDGGMQVSVVFNKKYWDMIISKARKEDKQREAFFIMASIFSNVASQISHLKTKIEHEFSEENLSFSEALKQLNSEEWKELKSKMNRIGEIVALKNFGSIYTRAMSEFVFKSISTTSVPKRKNTLSSMLDVLFVEPFSGKNAGLDFLEESADGVAKRMDAIIKALDEEDKEWRQKYMAELDEENNKNFNIEKLEGIKEDLEILVDIIKQDEFEDLNQRKELRTVIEDIFELRKNIVIALALRSIPPFGENGNRVFGYKGWERRIITEQISLVGINSFFHQLSDRYRGEWTKYDKMQIRNRIQLFQDLLENILDEQLKNKVEDISTQHTYPAKELFGLPGKIFDGILVNKAKDTEIVQDAAEGGIYEKITNKLMEGEDVNLCIWAAGGGGDSLTGVLRTLMWKSFYKDLSEEVDNLGELNIQILTTAEKRTKFPADLTEWTESDWQGAQAPLYKKTDDGWQLRIPGSISKDELKNISEILDDSPELQHLVNILTDKDTKINGADAVLDEVHIKRAMEEISDLEGVDLRLVTFNHDTTIKDIADNIEYLIEQADDDTLFIIETLDTGGDIVSFLHAGNQADIVSPVNEAVVVYVLSVLSNRFADSSQDFESFINILGYGSDGESYSHWMSEVLRKLLAEGVIKEIILPAYSGVKDAVAKWDPDENRFLKFVHSFANKDTIRRLKEEVDNEDWIAVLGILERATDKNIFEILDAYLKEGDTMVRSDFHGSIFSGVEGPAMSISTIMRLEDFIKVLLKREEETINRLTQIGNVPLFTTEEIALLKRVLLPDENGDLTVAEIEQAFKLLGIATESGRGIDFLIKKYFSDHIPFPYQDKSDRSHMPE